MRIALGCAGKRGMTVCSVDVKAQKNTPVTNQPTRAGDEYGAINE